MPWCPNCKMEYQEGVTECSDCKMELVDDLNSGEVLVPFFHADDEKVAEKLVRFFQYSDLNASMKHDEENDIYIVSIPPKKQAQAKKLYQAFYFVERERIENSEKNDRNATVNTTILDETKDINSPASEAFDDEAIEADETNNIADESTNAEAGVDEDYSEDTPGDEIHAFDDAEDDDSVYVMKEDQYKDLSGTVAIFLVFGIGGVIFVILNVAGVLHMLNGWLPNTVMGAVFLSFIYIALSTHQKAKKLQAEIDTEKKLTEEINSWLQGNVTESYLASIHNSSVSDELNYIKMTDTIKERLIKEFGSQNLAYLDRLIEEYYNKTFD